MRTSCNGCRVLRKGCSEDCVIRPSIEWMHSPDSQANATLFLAKFYGRAGLHNLLSAAHPPTLRPAIFKSLLYEACGRIVDPVNGSAGLMYSGQWQHCEAAVDAVLKGLPILQLQPHDPPGAAAGGDHVISPDVALKLCDIRHVSTWGHCSVHRRTTSNVNVAEAMDHDHEDDSLFSNETVEPNSWAQPGSDEPGLELTLGMTHYRSTCWL